MTFKTPLGRIGSDLWANIRMRAIHRELRGTENKRILDIGAANKSYMSEDFSNNNEITVSDLERSNLIKIRNRNYKRIILDLTTVDKNYQNYFDIIICADVLEHIEDDTLAMCNLYKLLRKDGVLLFTSPAYSRHFGIHDVVCGHFRRYDRNDVLSLANKANLKVTKIRLLVSMLLPIFLILQTNQSPPSGLSSTGQSHLEKKILFLLDMVSRFDEWLNLPFGITIMAVMEKRSN